jgi:hypothetical protein
METSDRIYVRALRPGKKAPGTHSVGGWLGASGGLIFLRKTVTFVTAETQTVMPRSSSSLPGLTAHTVPEPVICTA